MPDDFPTLLDWLYRLQRLGIKVGLEHSRQLLEACGNPHQRLESIHLAGTNGKGSTAATIAAILKAAGRRVGLYTSPHLVRFNERIRINGVPISDEEIVRFVQEYRTAIERVQATFFETTSALAFWHFERQEVDVAVVETGLGGRLDSTNIIEPAITAILPVGMDHTEILGDSLAKIAVEKAGIIKPQTPLVLAPQHPEAATVINNYAAQLAAPVAEVEEPQPPIVINATGTEFCWRGQAYRTPLIGHHQALNTACAMAAVRLFDPQISDSIIARGLASVTWPGRLQRLNSDPPVFYDVAHNEHGISGVLDNLGRMYPRQSVGVVAVKSDKEIKRLAAALQEGLDGLLVTSLPDTGLMDAFQLAASLSEAGVDCRPLPDFEAAMDWLLKTADSQQPGLVFGSHYLADRVFRRFGFSFETGII